jgi:hypothetical protein
MRTNVTYSTTQFIGFSISDSESSNTKTPSLQAVETKDWIGDTEYRIAVFLLNIAENALRFGKQVAVSPQDLVINRLASSSKLAWKYMNRLAKLGILEKVRHGLYRIDIAKLYEFLKLPVRKIAQALKNRQNGKANSGGRNQGSGSRQGFSALAVSLGGGCGGVHCCLPVVGSVGSGVFVNSWVGQPVVVGFYHDNVYLCRELGGGRRECVWVGGSDLLSERVVAGLVEGGYRLSYSERSVLVAGVRLESHIHTSPKCVVESGNVYCGVALEVQPYGEAKEGVLRGDGVADIARYREFYVNEIMKLFKIVVASLKYSVPWRHLLELFKWLARYWGFESILLI